MPCEHNTEKPVTRYSACLLFGANALARAITVIGEEEFGRLGLSYSHAYLLHEVIEVPGITPTKLSEALFLTPSTITRLIEKLEQKRLVRRETEGKNTLVYPTEQGVAMKEEISVAWQKTWSRYSEAIGEEQTQELAQQVFRAVCSLNDL